MNSSARVFLITVRCARWVAFVAAFTIAAGWSLSAQAQLTWSGATNTTWDTSSANWNPGPTAWSANSNAVFDTTASVVNRAITVSGTQSVGTLTVSSTNYSFSGGALRYTPVTSGTWTFNQGATINSGITATLSGTDRAFITTTNNSTAGTLTITGPVTMQGTGTNWFRPDGRFTFLGSTVTLTNVGLQPGPNNGATYLFQNSNVSITSSQTSGFTRGISITAGTINVVSSTITTPSMLVGNGNSATLTMTSGLITTGTLQFFPYQGTFSCNLNLNGGTIELAELYRPTDTSGSTTVTLSFDSGTLRALANNTKFINVTGSGTTTARVMAGGARFDTNGFDITVPVPLTSGTTNDGGLVKSSAGTLTLSASNGYVGTTAINGGILLVSHSSALAGGGNVTFGGGSLQYSGSNTADYSARIANSGSAVSIHTGGQSVIFAGGIGSSNTGGLTKLGSGTLSLSGSNGYTGATTLSDGVLAVGGNALAGGGNVTFSGGTLQYLSGNTADYSAKIKNSGSVVAIDTAGQSVTYSGAIDASNTAGLTKSGSGTLTLAGVNTFSGTTTVNAGTLAVGAGAQLGSTGIVKAAAGTLDLAGNNLTIRGLFNDAGQTSALVTNSGTGTVILTSTTPAGVTQSMTFYGTLADGTGGGKLGLSIGQSNGWSGSGNSFALGAGGTATYSGPTIIGTGSGATTVSGLVNPNSAYTVNGGAYLDVSGVTGTIGSLAGGYGYVVNWRGGAPATLSIGSLNTDSQYTGGIQDGSAMLSITKVGTGKLSMLNWGTNSYTGVTTVSQGVLNIQKDTALGTTAAGTVVTSGAALEIQGGIAVGAEALTLAGTGVSGAGALRNVSGTNTYGGEITLNAPARINSDLGRLTLSAAVGGAGQNLTIGGAGDVTILGSIATANGSLTKDGAGTLALSGTNTFSGATSISAGILAITGTSGLAGTSGVNIAGGAGLTYSGGTATFDRNITVTAGSGTGTIWNSGGGLLTLAGNLSKDNSVLRLAGGAFNVTGTISGTTAGKSDLVVAGTSSVTLSAANTYNGPTFVIESSTLAYGINNAIPSNSVVTLGNASSQGTLSMNGYTGAIGGLAFGTGGGTLRLAATSTSAAPLTAASGTMTLTNGTLDLAGSGSTAGLYRVLSAQSIGGSFASITGTSAAYQVITSSTSVDYQQRAVLGAVTVTNPAVSIITGGSAAFTYTVANSALSGGASLGFSSGSLSANLAGSSSGTAAAGGPSGAISGLFFTGTTVGSSQQGTFTVSAPTAYGATAATGTVSVTVLDHATSSLAGTLLTGTTITLGTYNYATGTWDSGGASALFSIYNLASSYGAASTADLSLVSLTGTGNGFTTNLLANYANIAGGTSSQFSIFFDPSGLNLNTSSTKSTTFQIAMSDKTGMSGATNTNTLFVTANVIVVPEPGAIALAGVGITAATAWTLRRRWPARA